MEFEYQPRRIDELLQDVREGRVALPEFQRGFVWKPKDVADLLRTIARRWPAGSFLLLENAAAELPFRPIARAPAAAQPQWLLLDGQQRMTSIYQALTNNADEVYFIDAGKLREDADFDDDHLKYLKKEKFAKEYPSIQAQAEARITSVTVLKDEAVFFEWLDHIPREERSHYLQLRREHLPGFIHYEIPMIRLTRDVPLAAVAKVFETLNRTGLKLGTFDLMVAKLYPHNFKLREEWAEVETSFPVFKQFGVSGVDLLKLIALREYLRQSAGDGPVRVKGIREGDVLQLSPSVVIAEWYAAIDGLQKALDFLRDHCGVVREILIPSHTMLLPLADALLHDAARKPDAPRRLATWFWASSFLQTYAQGANTQAVADARALRAWHADSRAVPAVVSNFSTRMDDSALLDSRRRNEILVAAIACLLISRDARDWKLNQRLKDVPDDVEIHHVFPDHFVESREWGDPPQKEDPHRVVNLTPLSGSTNAALRNDAPSTVLRSRDIQRSTLDSHKVPLDAFERDDYRTFSEKRQALLLDLMREVVQA